MSYLRPLKRNCPVCGAGLIVNLDNGSLTYECPILTGSKAPASGENHENHEGAKGSNHDG